MDPLETEIARARASLYRWQAIFAQEILRVVVASVSLNPHAMKDAALGVLIAAVRIAEAFAREIELRRVTGGTAAPPSAPTRA